MLSGENTTMAMKSVVADPSRYDWEGDTPLRYASARTIIYEMHVGGFTRHPNSRVADSKRGTFAGLVEKIPYLQDLARDVERKLDDHEVGRLLMTIEGVGPLTAACLIAELGDPARFDSPARSRATSA